jgi:predicted transposase YbfD/YdcC
MYCIARRCVLPSLTQEHRDHLLAEAALQSLADLLEAVPDPRRAHGLRYDLPFLLVCLVAGLLCNCDGTEAVAQWCHDQASRPLPICWLSVAITARKRSSRCAWTRKPMRSPKPAQVLPTLPIGQRVCTADALHIHAEFLRLMHNLGAETVLTVKCNQPTLYDDLATYFAGPQARYLQAETIDRRRGRLEVRTTTEVVYLITTLASSKASPERLLKLNRGHWSIENGSQYVRDVTDRGKTAPACAPAMPHKLWPPCVISRSP